MINDGINVSLHILVKKFDTDFDAISKGEPVSCVNFFYSGNLYFYPLMLRDAFL